ncbi:Septin and tuftelin-interacting protein 1-like protein 1 [Diplonema papillatum]|nr:Septin and tuftelin-interacting protein 1-like protein 1 [Diplonema papillatum]|eukprot:gene7012-10821_t
MLGLDDYASSGSSASSDAGPNWKKKRKRGKDKTGVESAWLGHDADSGDDRRGPAKRGKEKDGPVEFIQAAALAPEKQPEPAAPAPAAAAAAADGMPPKTKAKFTVTMASAKLKPTDEGATTSKPAPSMRDKEKSLEVLQAMAGGGAKSAVMLRMMKKAGYKPGHGMGKHEQGISEAIAVKVRPKGMGVGGISEKTAQQMRRERIEQGLPAEETNELYAVAEDITATVEVAAEERTLTYVKLKRRERERGAWKKRKESRKVETAFTFGGVATVVDMTNRGADDAGGAASELADASGGTGCLKTLRSQLSMLLDETESKARLVDEKLTAQTTLEADLVRRVDSTVSVREKQERSIEEVDIVLRMLSKLQDKIAGPGGAASHKMTPRALAAALRPKLWAQGAEFGEVYGFFKRELDSLIVTLSLPLFRRAFARLAADPAAGVAAAPDAGLEDMRCFREVLLPESRKTYAMLVWEHVGVPFRAFCTRWDPFEFPRRRAAGEGGAGDPAVVFAERWFPLLPAKLISVLLDGCIAPKLLQAVENYTEAHCIAGVHLHAIVTPWHRLLSSLPPDTLAEVGDFMEERGLLSAVHERLVHLLQQPFAAEDVAASLRLVLPWKAVLNYKAYNHVHARYLVARAVRYLQEAPVHLSGDFAALSAVAAWCEGDPNVAVAVLPELHGSYALRVLSVMSSFLKETAGHREAHTALQRFVAALGPGRSRKVQAIKGYGVALIKASVAWWAAAGGGAAAAAAEFDFARASEGSLRDLRVSRKVAAAHAQMATTVSHTEQLHAAVLNRTAAPDASATSVREQIAILAGEENLAFRPKSGLAVDGKQVYAMGKLLLYFDASCIFIQEPSKDWRPAEGVAEVFQRAAQLEKKKQRTKPPESRDAAMADID